MARRCRERAPSTTSITDIPVLIEIDCYLPDGSANGSVHGRVELLQGKCMKYLRKREAGLLT